MHERSRPVGMSTFSAELLTDSTSSTANSTGRENCRSGQGGGHRDDAGRDDQRHVDPREPRQAHHRATALPTRPVRQVVLAMTCPI